MLIPYIFYLDEDGLINETKYQKENVPRINQLVTTFYDESVNVYNVSGLISGSNRLFLNKENKLSVIEKDEFKSKSKKSLKDFIGYIKYLNNDTFNNNFKDEPSLIYSMEFFVKDYLNNDSFKVKSRKLSVEDFKESFNQIMLLNMTGNIELSKAMLMTKFLKSSLTIVYDELNISPLNYNNFISYTDQDDIKHLNPGEAYSNLSSDLPSMCSNYRSFYRDLNKKNNNKNTI
jgi:hypothetical protein